MMKRLIAVAARHGMSRNYIINSSFFFSQGTTVVPSPNSNKDLFTVKHSSFPAPVLGWQMGLPQGMGISMHYNNAVPMPHYPQPSKSANPFDVSSKPIPDQTSTFPSMSPLQGALPMPSGPMYPSGLGNPSHAWTPPMSSMQGAPPNLPPSGTMHPSSLGNPSHGWSPVPSSYQPVMPLQTQTHAPALGQPRPYMGQQMPTNIPMPRQDIGNFGMEGLSNPDQQLAGRPSTTSTSNPFPSMKKYH